MTPTRIGACLRSSEIADHRAWLFDQDRDIELQDFMRHDVLMGDWRAAVAQARRALDGHQGRLGIHGPYEGLDLDNKDPQLRPLITARLLTALDCAAAVGARQMVLHSPYRRWYQQNLLNSPNYAAAKADRVHQVLSPVVARAEAEGITLVIENIEDVDPATRRALAQSFGSDAVALSVDTGHAHLARAMSGAPPVDYFLRDAGALLRHVHVQDVDGHADRHWPPGDGEIAWRAVFAALSDSDSAPHVVLELRDKAQIPRGFAWLRDQGLVV